MEGLKSVREGLEGEGELWRWDPEIIQILIKASLVAQTVKHLPAMRETWVRPLGWEYPLEKKMATHSSTLAWKIPWTEEPCRLHGIAKSWTRLSNFKIQDMCRHVHREERSSLMGYL